MSTRSIKCACGKVFVVWHRDVFDADRTECRACECKRDGHRFTVSDAGQKYCFICLKRLMPLRTMVSIVNKRKHTAVKTG